MGLHIGITAGRLFSARGGAERMGVNLARGMLKRGHRVTLFGEKARSEVPIFPVEPSVKLWGVDYTGTHENIRRFRAALRASDIDVCVVRSNYLFWMVALLGSGIPCVYSENNSPSYFAKYWSTAGRLAAMSGADRIHVMVSEFKDALPDFLRDRATVIPHPCPEFDLAGVPERAEKPPFILASLGRIAPVKQIPMLIDAFGIIHQRFPEWELHIWGSEDGETGIARHIVRSPAGEAIHWHGPSDAPVEVFSKSHLFCIPSREEGMPNAVLEAMACGVPIVGFADCPGVNSLVQTERNGLLAPEMTITSLVETLSRLMTDSQLRIAMGREAQNTMESYGADTSFNKWEELCRETAASKGHTRMDAFSEEPFASMARLSAMARREYLFRDFGMPYPGTLAYVWSAFCKKVNQFYSKVKLFYLNFKSIAGKIKRFLSSHK